MQVDLTTFLKINLNSLTNKKNSTGFDNISLFFVVAVAVSYRAGVYESYERRLRSGIIALLRTTHLMFTFYTTEHCTMHF